MLVTNEKDHSIMVCCYVFRTSGKACMVMKGYPQTVNGPRDVMDKPIQVDGNVLVVESGLHTFSKGSGTIVLDPAKPFFETWYTPSGHKLGLLIFDYRLL